MRVGFMSAISPDGRYVVTTVGVDQDLSRNYYVANFKDYRFLQVFYATRGVLTVYDRTTGRRQSLPGRRRPALRPDQRHLEPGRQIPGVRARLGRDAYPEGHKVAEYAGDPNETEVQYDLYRVPFNDGRGGTAEPMAGASRNGMSNSFPRISPDGRWMVFVQARNGLLMRPDSQLYIVPAAGGAARRMSANTPLMNSWHSFSPNGRWLVFSSKGRSPYTQMYLTHIDEEGNDSPAILIENSTAANRAVNLPEFVNILPGGLSKIEVPAAEFYARFDRAWELSQKQQFRAAIDAWRSALDLNPDDARANNNLGFALAREGRLADAITAWETALKSNDQTHRGPRQPGARARESRCRATAKRQSRRCPAPLAPRRGSGPGGCRRSVQPGTRTLARSALSTKPSCDSGTPWRSTPGMPRRITTSPSPSRKSGASPKPRSSSVAPSTPTRHPSNSAPTSPGCSRPAPMPRSAALRKPSRSRTKAVDLSHGKRPRRARCAGCRLCRSGPL